MLSSFGYSISGKPNVDEACKLGITDDGWL